MARKHRRITSRQQGPPRKPWSLLVYIAGDNNLSDFGIEDIQEMCTVGASDTAHVAVEIDTVGDYTGSIRYEIDAPDWSGQACRRVVERLSEKDTGDPETLREFLKWGISRCDADKRLVVVWNHGAGFRLPARDIGYDDYGTSLDMVDIEMAFDQAGISESNKISVLGFDACLMNMLEIAHHLHYQVEFLVGSQEIEPGDGWPYDKVLREANKNLPPRALASKIVDAYIRDYRQRGQQNVTQSAIDLSKTPALVDAVNSLGDLLADALPDIRPEVHRARLRAQSYEMSDYADLGHTAALIAELVDNRRIQTAAKSVVTRLRSCVVKSAKIGVGVDNSNGLSFWFPTVRDLYLANRAKYVALHCNQQTSGWVRFLDTFHD